MTGTKGGLVMETREERSGDGLVALFRIGEADFGLDARRVQEVQRVGPITYVPGAPAGVVGIHNLRGRIIVVEDLAEHLGLGRVVFTPETRMLILDGHGDVRGFLVDAAADAVDLDPALVHAPPAGLPAVLRERLSGVWLREGRLVSLVDADALLAGGGA